MRVAWFSPLPPHRSGIANYSADVLPGLASMHTIDAFVDDSAGADAARRTAPIPGMTIRGAHDFPWTHPQHPYECIVYQLGNDSCHDYMWPYLLRYPGLVVLHDAQLHQARARALLREGREEDYVKEFMYSHPLASEAVARVVASGLGGSLYYLWPMVRVPVEAARLVAVHNRWLADDLSETYPGTRATHVRMGVPDPLLSVSIPPLEIRRRHGIPDDGVVFGAFGRVTPEKSLTRMLMALAQLGSQAGRLHILCVGGTADDYDIRKEAQQLGVGARVHVTGYVPEDELPSYLAAVDVCLCLRWPTARETSGSWLRSVAAGKPTVINDLVHTLDIPAIDLRTMAVRGAVAGVEPVAVGIDMLDDIHMLRLTLARMSEDVTLRRRIGEAARRYWQSEATVEIMTRDYVDAIAAAASMPAPTHGPDWPAHLTADGTETVRSLLTAPGLAEVMRSRLDGLFAGSQSDRPDSVTERP